MKKINKHIKLHYYQARIKIDTTVLLEFLNKEILFEDEQVVKVFEVYNIVFIATSRNDIMKEIESLYPTVFQPFETPLYEGKVIFSTE